MLMEIKCMMYYINIYLQNENNTTAQINKNILNEALKTNKLKVRYTNS